MAGSLEGKRVAILATDGFEQSELLEPRRALTEAGAETELLSLQKGRIRGWHNKNWGDEIEVDGDIAEADPKDYDGLLLPGGMMNPDKLRLDAKAVAFVRSMFAAGKPIGAICHGPWLLVEAGIVRGRRLTSWPSLRTDIRNAGGEWVDQEVVTDRGLVTSRKPDDLPAFNRKLLEELGEGTHEGRREATIV
jgi:protease I